MWVKLTLNFQQIDVREALNVMPISPNKHGNQRHREGNITLRLKDVRGSGF